MKIERFEDIEAWQLAPELTQKVYRADKEARICEGLWAEETDTRCCRIIDA